MKRRNPLADIVLITLFSLYLGAVLIAVGTTVPASLHEALRWGGVTSLPVGPLGEVLGRSLNWLLGPYLRWLVPVAPGLWLWFRPRRRRGVRWAVWAKAVASTLVFLGILGHDAWTRLGLSPTAGGVIGDGVERATAGLFGALGSFLLLTSVGAFLLLRRLPPLHISLPALDPVQDKLMTGWELATRLPARARQSMAAAWERLRPEPSAELELAAAAPVDSGPVIHQPPQPVAPPPELDEPEPVDIHSELETDQGAHDAALVDELLEEVQIEPVAEAVDDDDFRLSRDPRDLIRAEEPVRRARRPRGKLPLPGLDLLEDVPKEERGFTPDVLQMKARLLMETLSHYGIEGKINEIRPGPVVTTFEFEPAPGVKVSQITSRQDDLALAMRATRIRIEAPIPGKAAVGIEIPNPFPQMVTLKEVIGAIPPEGSPLQMALGKDTEGSPHIADLAEMPHLLVAGATGSGKSVCINAIICNLLLRNGPDKLRLLMVDPKMLELSVYNGIPHLMHPVITEAREALKAVKWAVAEMTVRYHKLAKHGVRNIADYNRKVTAGEVKDAEGKRVKETMPYFVIIIDELADLMMQLGQDLETPVARLAQMARAVGIHLVLATQRPSVNVITGVIKANFPSRIAFRVMSKVDSRTILDSQGGEQLLGKGDMLFLLAGSPQPVRVHGAYLDIEECERIVEHWREYTDEDAHLDLDSSEGGSGVDLGEDELLDDAKRLVVMTQTGSTSMLQRRLRVGYTRAARLMDMLEANGVVGPFEGSKAREVLVSRDQLEGEA